MGGKTAAESTQLFARLGCSVDPATRYHHIDKVRHLRVNIGETGPDDVYGLRKTVLSRLNTFTAGMAANWSQGSSRGVL